jgi:hypothetical protein
MRHVPAFAMVTVDHLRVLRLFFAGEIPIDRLTHRDLVSRLQTESGFVRDLVDQMHRLGIIDGAPAASGRADDDVIRITQRGIDVRDQVFHTMRFAFIDWMARIGTARYSQFEQILAEMWEVERKLLEAHASTL